MSELLDDLDLAPARVVERVKDRNEKLLQDNIDMCAGRKVKR